MDLKNKITEAKDRLAALERLRDSNVEMGTCIKIDDTVYILSSMRGYRATLTNPTNGHHLGESFPRIACHVEYTVLADYLHNDDWEIVEGTFVFREAVQEEHARFGDIPFGTILKHGGGRYMKVDCDSKFESVVNLQTGYTGLLHDGDMVTVIGRGA